MAVYAKWFYADERVWCFDELDEGLWPTRHIEVAEDGRVVVAASLREVLSARDTGGTSDVVAYERRYGVAPEAGFPQPGTEGFDPGFVDASDFEELWKHGRKELEARDVGRSGSEPAYTPDPEPTE